MKASTLAAIRSAVDRGDSPQQIAEAHPDVLYDTIVSIWSACWQARETEAIKQLKRKNGAAKEEIVRSFVSGSSLVPLARARDLSPVALARELLLEAGWGRASVRELLRDPAALWRTPREGVAVQLATQAAMAPASVNSATPPADADSASPPTPASAASAASSSPPPPTSATAAVPAVPSARSAAPVPATSRLYHLLSTVSLDRWRDEIQACLDQDEHNSPFLDNVKNLTGSYYEDLLASHLRAHGVSFVSESSLRAGGVVSKTPDFVLPVPIVVAGHVINWIDSKAQFADSAIKRAHVEQQLRKYVNRDGSGAVIYWLDFVEGEADSESVPLPDDVVLGEGVCHASLAPSSFARPASVDNGQILMLTDFPAKFQTMSQLMQQEARAIGAATNKADSGRIEASSSSLRNANDMPTNSHP